jgi:hypothetical protein
MITDQVDILFEEVQVHIDRFLVFLIQKAVFIR